MSSKSESTEQKQVPVKRNSSTHIETPVENAEVRVVDGCFHFKPYITIENEDGTIKEEFPTLTWIKMKSIEYTAESDSNSTADSTKRTLLTDICDRINKGLDQESFNSDPDSSDPISIYQSDRFYDRYVEEINCVDIHRDLVPVISMEVEFLNQDVENALVTIQNPFSSDAATDLFGAIEHNQHISITRKDSDLLLSLGSKQIPVTLKSNIKRNFPLDRKSIRETNNSDMFSRLVDSGVQDWMLVQLNNVQRNDGKYILDTKYLDKPIVLDDPVISDPTHKTVKFLQNYLSRSEQLTNIYIRPHNPLGESDVESIQVVDNWELAVDKLDMSDRESTKKGYSKSDGLFENSETIISGKDIGVVDFIIYIMFAVSVSGFLYVLSLIL